MSMGYGAYAHLIDEDETMVMYSYSCYDVCDPEYPHFKEMEDGEIYVSRDAFVEPDIHRKLKRMPSGRKKVIEKRIPKDVDFKKLYSEGKIKIKNASGTWMINPDGADVMAFHLIFQLFSEYQTQGMIPLKLSAYY